MSGGVAPSIREVEAQLETAPARRPVAERSRPKVSPEAIRIIPADFARNHRILPLEIENGTIRIGTATPGNQRVIDDLRLLTGLEVVETVLPAAQILEQIAESYQVTVEKMVEGFGGDEAANGDGKNQHDIEVMANEPTVVNLVNLIVATALGERASDIHLVPFESTIQLRYRVDGLLQEKPPPPKHLHAALVSRIKIMADMNIAERFSPQDGHIQIQHRGARVDIRVGTMPTIYGESLVMRLLEKDSKIQTHQELGLDPERSAMLAHLVEKPHGLFLATGPTGSGKTTTLYSVLRSIYTPELKILTIEDPVEYELAGVAQIPVRPSRNFTFANGLRAILRQDPDVVMVGEIRDSETARNCHSRRAHRASRFQHAAHQRRDWRRDPVAGRMGVEAFLISSALEGVLAQRLVRRVCPECRVETPVSAVVREQLEVLGNRRVAGAFYRGAGCEQCRGTGYRGRIGIFELLAITTGVAGTDLARNGPTPISRRRPKNP